MTVLALTFLGRFDIQTAGTTLGRIRFEKVRALLAYLAIEAERPHSRGYVAGLLWPDQPDELALRNLSQTLIRMREAIGDRDASTPFVLITRQTIQWNQKSDYQLDVAAFTTLARSPSFADLEQAAELYGGELLPSFSISGCDAFHDWLLLTREVLQHQALAVLDRLTTHYFQSGSYRAAGAAARRQLALDPWRETAHRQLMAALAGIGDRASALAQYAACRRTLESDLGVEPDVATTQLYLAIKQGAPAPREVGLAAPPTELAPDAPARLSATAHLQDRLEAPELGAFYGRAHELETITRWAVRDRCHLIALVGLGGVGKTALAVRLIEDVATEFDSVIWRSLLNAPPLAEVLRAILATLSLHQAAVPGALDAQIDLVLERLRQRRCLLVFDNLESIMVGGAPTPHYHEGYEAYGTFLLRVGQDRHQSCVVITSREEPPEISRMLGTVNDTNGPVQALGVRGLDEAAAAAILQQHGIVGTAAGLLVHHYSGHPLALKLVADTVRDVYAGDVALFLHEDAPVFGDILTVLDEQFARLSRLEQDILVWLALAREPSTIPTLQSALLDPPRRGALLDAIRSLQRRALLDVQSAALVLQNVVIEYVTDRVIAQVHCELSSGAPDWLLRFAIVQSGVKEYVRQSQVRLVAQPIVQYLGQRFGRSGTRDHVSRLLDMLRQSPGTRSYAAGNLLTLLVGQGNTVQGYDFSELCVWQADLRNVEVRDVSFVRADLTGTRFTDTFASVITVQFTPDGELLLAASADGTVRLWHVPDGRPAGVLVGHSGVVWSVAVSPDGRWCVSGGDDGTVRVWDLETRQPLRVLQGHTHGVQVVTVSPDGRVIASGSHDETIQIWDATSGDSLHTLRSPGGATYALAFAPLSAPRSLLASAGTGSMFIHLWDTASGAQVQTLSTEGSMLLSLAWSPDGTRLLSSGHDPALRFWDTATWQLERTVTGHTAAVASVAFSPDGALVVSGSSDTTVRLWDAHSGQQLRTLYGHPGWIHGIAFSPDGVTVASGGADQTARLWHAPTGRELFTLVGHSQWIPALAFTPDGHTLVSGHWDHTVALWDMQKRTLRQTLKGHSERVTSVACSPNGLHVASGSTDATVCVWSLSTGEQLRVLRGHTAGVLGVAFDPAGRLLTSQSEDGSVRIWDVGTGHLLHTLGDQPERIGTLAFSPDGQILATACRNRMVLLWSVGSWELLATLAAPSPGGHIWRLAFDHTGSILAGGYFEGTVDLWDVATRTWVRRLHGHTNVVDGLAFTPDDTRLVSGSHDATIRVWDVATGHEQRAWAGHAIRTMAIAFRPTDGDPGAPPVLASSGCDALIKLWDIETASSVDTFQAPGPYGNVDITGATGLTASQRLALVALGAIDQQIAP